MAANGFEGWVYEHVAYKKAMESVCDVVDRALGGGRPFVLSILGQSGVGKSELLQDMLARYAGCVGSSGHPRLLYVPVPSGATTEALCARIVKTTVGDVEVKGKRHEVLDMASQVIEGSERCILVLDEVNRLAETFTTERAQTKENRHTADWLQEQFEQKRISLILTGLLHSVRVRTDNEQLDSRAMRNVELHPYDWSEETERDSFIQIVQAFVNRLVAWGWTVSADDAELVIKGAYLCSGGLMRRLHSLFAGSLELGTDKRLDLRVLGRVFDRDFPEAPYGNPFNLTSIPDTLLNMAHQNTLALARAPLFQETGRRSGKSRRSAPK